MNDSNRRPWLKARLRELDKTPASLARHVGVLAPEVYLWIAGVDIPPQHLPKIASFLDWPLDKVA